MSSFLIFLLNDRYHRTKLLLTVLSIAAMIGYGVWYHPPLQSLLLYMNDPAAYDGQVLITGPHRILSVNSDGFVIDLGNVQGAMPFEVRTQDRGVLNQINPGEQITVQGTFHRDGAMTLSAFHVHRGRDLKIVISIIPLAVVAILLGRAYTVSRYPSWRVTLRERDADA